MPEDQLDPSPLKNRSEEKNNYRVFHLYKSPIRAVNTVF
jgi:hypothetical protein